MNPADGRRQPGRAHDWLDAEAGPVVRPYAVTGGRSRPAVDGFDLLAFVVAVAGTATLPGTSTLPGSASAARWPARPRDNAAELLPEHRAILVHCVEPVSVAELASHLDLALGVVRVLLSDLLNDGLISMHEPGAGAHRPDERVLKAVINGLRTL